MSCPICGKEAKQETRPFCSKRCADADLGKWLTRGYAIASEDPDDIEQAREEAEALNRKPH